MNYESNGIIHDSIRIIMNNIEAINVIFKLKENKQSLNNACISTYLSR